MGLGFVRQSPSAIGSAASERSLWNYCWARGRLGGVPTHICKDLHFNQQNAKKSPGQSQTFFSKSMANLPKCIIPPNPFGLKEADFGSFRFPICFLGGLPCFAKILEVQISVTARIGPGDSPAQLLHLFAMFTISCNSDNGDEDFQMFCKILEISVLYLFVVCIGGGTSRAHHSTAAGRASPSPFRNGSKLIRPDAGPHAPRSGCDPIRFYNGSAGVL